MRLVVSLPALLRAVAPAHAAETRTSSEGHVPRPAAAVAQLAWLAGIRTGGGIGGATAAEGHSPSVGGSAGECLVRHARVD